MHARKNPAHGRTCANTENTHMHTHADTHKNDSKDVVMAATAALTLVLKTARLDEKLILSNRDPW